MRQEPPTRLIELLERTGLATAGQVRGVRGRAKRLARGLPLFESVWIDALAQARVITRFQAVRINSGQVDSLCVGPYLLDRSLPSAGYMEWFRAREVESGRKLRLAIIEDCGNRPDSLLDRLERLLSDGERLACENLSRLVRTGEDDGRIWVAHEDRTGWSAAEWMVHNGRFPPEVVLEIARQMLSGLIEMEIAGLCHGDICSLGLILTDKGRVILSPPGLRGAIRPEEGYGLADLAPEYYDYLAPERADTGSEPTIASDIYSAGCLWWHLLTGRPPVPGGNGLAKLRGHQTADIPDVCQLAPDTPGHLATAIRACCQRDPDLRPESMARLSKMLGLPTKPGRTKLTRCTTGPVSPMTHSGVSIGAVRRPRKTLLPMAVTAGSVVVAVVMFWSSWHAGGPLSATESASREPPASRRQIETPATSRSGNQTPDALPPNGHPDRLPIVGSPDDNSRAVLPTGYDAVANPARSDPNTVGRARQARADLDKKALPARHKPVGDRPDARGAEGNVIVLSGKVPIKGESLQLAAGQHVRGTGLERPVVEVSSGGLVVRPENVRFENVDFVWKAGSDRSPTGHRPAIIRLEASRAEFRGCSFQPAGAESGLVAAIRWTHPVDRNELDLPHGQVVVADCVFHRVEAAIACQTAGAVSLELSNVLHLDGGPLILLDHAPVQDEPVGIGLTNVTLRDSGAVLECEFTKIASRPGRLSIRANGSAFVPRPNATLLSFAGPNSPEKLLWTIYWTGQGSLVSPQTVIAGWRRPDGQTEVLDDAAVSMAGLVRSKVGFAGSAKEDPAASQIVEWQVPLRTSDPPGIDPRSLFQHER